VKLFEVGRRYLAEGERPTLGLVLAGVRGPRDWRAGKSEPFDPFDVKAVVIALLEAAGAPTGNLPTSPKSLPSPWPWDRTAACTSSTTSACAE